ncbi:MAG: hypothetical protein Q8865_04635 [Bacillota bacterium]|nr:hypothetical protein [Bacillota bacterium]
MKKTVSVVLSLLVSANLFSFGAFAQSTEDKIDQTIDKANVKVESSVEKAQATDKVDVDKLTDKTGKITDKVEAKVAKEGGEVICEDKTYEVDGQTVTIDPFKAAY